MLLRKFPHKREKGMDAKWKAAWGLTVALGLASPGFRVHAGQDRVPRPEWNDLPSEVLTDGFLEGHPDLYYRKAGLRADEAGDFARARRQYRMAARYGDKPSQARLGEMCWKGQGGSVDRVAGFLWMSLAAERGYEMFANLKMQYWAQLSAAQREQAGRQDQGMLAEYGDQAARPRQEKVMRKALKRSTGSLLGYSGQALTIVIPGRANVPAERFYARDFWEPKAYWQLQDRVWSGRTPGRVTVGDVEAVAPPAETQSRREGTPVR
jgi:hypothetical protein